MAFRESDFIAWVTRDGACGLPVGPGDDAAVLPDGTVVGVDVIVEGTHFDPGTPLDLVARKALGACLSDLCAMGARAEAVFVAVQMPPGCDGRALAEGLARWARHFGVVLAGGDTVATRPGALALAVTATGHLQGQAWTRAGGRPGDRLVVTGPLGGSRSGRHLRPRPRSDVVAAFVQAGQAPHACLDLSDGLGCDLPRLCAASGVGAVVDAERVPVHPDVGADRDPLTAALDDGEDFELLLALGPDADVPAGGTVIGELGGPTGIQLRRAGVEQPWPSTGYEHVF